MRKRILIGCAALAALAAVGFIWLRPETQRAGPWKLADGSELSLAGVTYGANHTFVYGNRIADYIYRIAPSAFRGRFSRKAVSFPTIDSNGVVVWMWHRGINTNSATIFLAAGDDFGIESQPFRPISTTVWQKTNALYGFRLYEFPRRSAEIVLKAYTLKNPARPIALFKILNRTATNYPVWSGPPPPVTTKAGGLEVTLVSFGMKTGTSQLSPAFSISGPSAEKWSLGTVTVVSATGESYRSLYMPSPFLPGHAARHDFYGLLWNEESAWKVAAEFWRNTNFPVGELWTVDGIPVPPGREIRSLNLSTNIYNSPIEITSIKGMGPMTRAVNDLSSRSYYVLSVSSPYPCPDKHLLLAEMVDDRGRNVPAYRFRSVPTTGGRGATLRQLDEDYSLEVADDARSLRLILAYTKSSSVNFLVGRTR